MSTARTYCGFFLKAKNNNKDLYFYIFTVIYFHRKGIQSKKVQIPLICLFVCLEVSVGCWGGGGGPPQKLYTGISSISL